MRCTLLNAKAWKQPRLLLTMFLLMVVGTVQAWSQTSNLSAYQYSVGSTGSFTTMTGASQIYAAGNDDVSTGPYNIGFNFVFCGTTYTQFSVSSNGAMGLGSSVISSTLSPYLGSTTVAAIAGMWCDMYTEGNGIRYLLSGSSPNRVLTVEF